MSTPTHLLIGATIAKTALLISAHHPAGQLYTIAMISAIAPDIDILAYGINPKHHESLLHKPILWTGLLALLFSANALLGLHYTADIAIAAIALLSHFILDTGNYSQGVQWLWPLSKTVIHFFKLAKRPNTAKERWRVFSHHPAFAAEVLVVISALIFLL